MKYKSKLCLNASYLSKVNQPFLLSYCLMYQKTLFNISYKKVNRKAFICKCLNMVRSKEISFEDRVAIKTLQEMGYICGEITKNLLLQVSVPVHFTKLTSTLVLLQFARG